MVNDIDVKKIKKSNFIDKIEFIKGDWENEQDQRNHCLKIAKEKGYDILFIQDPDEFYKYEDLLKLKEIFKNNLGFSTFYLPWMCFWKEQKYVLLNEFSNPITGFPLVAINLKKNVFFSDKRNIKNLSLFKRKKLINNVVCYHNSFVLENSECEDKINSWGHTNEVDSEWFKNKFLNWNIKTQNLHPVNPKAWKKAIEFNGELPEILRK
jgi:hypothetical protein